MAKRQQEGGYDEIVVAKSKPVRNLVSRSCCGTINDAIFDGIFMSRETRNKPSSNNQQENLIKRDRVTNSQERHEETRSRATTGSSITQKPSQTEDLTACTGYPVPTFKSWDAGSGLETKEECDILSVFSISVKEKVDERLRIMLNCLRGKEMKDIDKNSLIWRIFSDLY